MTAITIRDVPQETRDELAARASLQGQSLQQYLRARLIDIAGKPDKAELLARIQEWKREHGIEISAEEIVGLRDADRR